MISPALANEWGDPRTKIAIVDEGPGLSGSSFGAVTDLLEERGVATERIECFPGHAGDLGPQASTRHRERWRRLRRHVVHVDALLLHTATPAHALSRWIAELVGPLIGPLEDISAGAWRARRYAREADWPPSVTSQERRKLLARTRDATWVARFVGLGAVGHHALARARALHSAGFTPTVAGLCHGFLVERWLEATTPLDPPYCERERVIDQVGRYLGFRARRFPAGAEDGASIARLLEMLRRNTTLALGPSVATAIDRWDRAASDLEARPQRIEIDGRLHGWEWLVGRDGRLLKSDAIDHHAAHDLIGCQDVTWDVAGAAIELGMSSAEQRRLCAVVGDTAGRVPDPELLALARPCYLAFQLGRHALAIGTSGEAEAARLRAAVDRYASALHAELAR